MAREVVGRQIVHPLGHVHADKTEGLLVFELNASQVNIFVRRIAVVVMQMRLRSCFDFQELGHIVLDGFEQRRQVELEPQPARVIHCSGHKGTPPLLAPDQAFVVQQIDCLAYRDLGDSELTLQFLDRGDLAPGLPVPGLDPAAQRRCDLKIERDVAASMAPLQHAVP